MKIISYSVIQYRHDRASEEALNVGVLAYDPGEGKAALEFDKSYVHLADLYHSFDGRGYRLAFRKLLSALSVLGHGGKDALFLIHDDRLLSSDDVARSVWPDQGLSLALSKAKFVAASDVEVEAKSLYRRYVSGLRKPQNPVRRRNDENLWQDILGKSARFGGLAARFEPAKVGPQEVAFNYAARAGSSRFVAIEPVSLDYLNSSSALERAYSLGEKAYELHDYDQFERLYVLLGEPIRQSESAQVGKRARAVLEKFPKVKVFDEDNAQGALSEVAAALR